MDYLEETYPNEERAKLIEAISSEYMGALDQVDWGQHNDLGAEQV